MLKVYLNIYLLETKSILNFQAGSIKGDMYGGEIFEVICDVRFAG